MNNKDLIAQYVDTGQKLTYHQIKNLPTWAKKTYLRKRLISVENGGNKLNTEEFNLLEEVDKIEYLDFLSPHDLNHLLRTSTRVKDDIIKLYIANIDINEKHAFNAISQNLGHDYKDIFYDEYFEKYPTKIRGHEISDIVTQANNPLYFITKFLKSDYVLSILKTKIIEYMFQEISVVKFIRGLEGEEKDKVTLALLSNASPYNLEELIQKVFLLSSDNVKLKTLLSKTAPGNSGLLYTLIKIAPRGILIPFIKQLPNDYDLSDNSHPMYDLLPDEAKVIYDKRRLSEQMQKEQLPPKMIRVLSLEELLRNVTNKAGQKVLNGWIRQAKGAEMIKLSGKQQKLLTTIRGGGPNPKDYHSKNEQVLNEKSVKGFNYVVYNPSQYTFMIVPIDKFLERYSDMGSLDVRNPDNQIGNRVAKAKDFITNKDVGDNKYDDLIPTYARFEDNKLKIGDGRHRVVALKELGYEDVGIQIPNEQVELFTKIFLQ